MKERKAMVERASDQLSVRRQCQLLAVNRNRLDPPRSGPHEKDLETCRLIDEIHLEAPAFGSRMIRDLLREEHGVELSRGKVRTLMRQMGIEALYRKPHTSLPGKGSEHKIHPYLLRGRKVCAPDEVWCADITYIPMGRSFAYLVAVMDWYTRAVLSWGLSNTLGTGFCLEAFADALKVAGTAPGIFNTDQGSQFTAQSWRKQLESHGVRISMDGKGRWIDNVFIERLWRTVKYEEIYLREYGDLHELERALGRWFNRYNTWRPHSSLGGKRPWEIYRLEEGKVKVA